MATRRWQREFIASTSWRCGTSVLLLLLAIAGVVLVVSFATRQVGPYELGLLFEIPIVIVVMRDFGTYENHLIDLEVLSGLVVAGLWSKPAKAEWMRVGRVAVVVCLVAAALAADRYTLIPFLARQPHTSFEVDPIRVNSTHPAPQLVRMGTCALFEDALIPILAGQLPWCSTRSSPTGSRPNTRGRSGYWSTGSILERSRQLR